MKKILRYRLLTTISIVAWILSTIGFILCWLYIHREWNAPQFYTFYAHWDFLIAYLLESIGILVFFIIFIITSQSSNNTFRKILAQISFYVLNLGVIAVFITLIANCIGIERVINDYRLDCQLQSDDKEKVHEAIDALIPLAIHDYYATADPNSFILNSARKGYPNAQNAMGIFYHKRAKIALSDAEHEQYGPRHHELVAQSESDFDSAIFWFLKAAQTNYSSAQVNLGRILMGNLASNRYPDIELAKSWLLKACKNNDPDAFYYLGLIYSNENLRDAYIYWSKGAELGNEDCTKALEKPEFANGIPSDRKNTEPVVMIDSANTSM